MVEKEKPKMTPMYSPYMKPGGRVAYILGAHPLYLLVHTKHTIFQHYVQKGTHCKVYIIMSYLSGYFSSNNALINKTQRLPKISASFASNYFEQDVTMK